MTTITEHPSGRVLLLEWDSPLDGSGAAHAVAAARAVAREQRFVLLDMTHATYADTGGLRWLFRLRGQAEASGKRLRIAAHQGGKIWRNLALVAAGLEVYGSVSEAWAAPWRSNTALRFGFRQPPPPTRL